MTAQTRNTFRFASVLVLTAALASTACAVMPVTIDQSSEADFTAGQIKSVAITSEGEIELGRNVTVLVQSKNAPAVVSALAVDGQTLYAASGVDNAIYKIQDGKSVKFASPGGTMIGSLLMHKGKLLAGVNGEQGAGVYRIDRKGKSSLFWSNADVKYVWAMVAAPDGKLFVATGPKAQVFAVNEKGEGDKLFEAPDDLAKNILCLAYGNDLLYAGTDENGLVLEINPRSKASRVLLDASEKEISALVLAENGGLYAATSDSAKASAESSDSGDETVERATPLPAVISGPMDVEMAKSKPASVPTSTGAAPKADAKANANAKADNKAAPVKTAASQVATSAPAAAKTPQKTAAKPAAKSVKSPASPLAVRRVPTMPTRAAMPAMAGGGAADGIDGPGNAVYFIASDGLVRVVFRKPVTIHAMLPQDHQLILGTGNSGQIIRVDPAQRVNVILADLESSQITCLAATAEGDVFFGAANKGSIGKMAQTPAKEGTFTSKAIDAQQIAKWGTIRVDANVPKGASLKVSTRTGNVTEPDDKTWSAWSCPAAAQDGYVNIDSPAGRFMQYRLSFALGDASPVARAIRVIYQVGNLAPEIAAVTLSGSGADGEGEMAGPRPTATPAMAAANQAARMAMMMRSAQPQGGGPQPQSARALMIQATDPNNDQMNYTVEYRQVGTPNWIKIADKIDQPMYAWDTRTVADGQYELRVTVSDSPSNPPAIALTTSKITPPVTVDNTPPVLKEFSAKVENKTIRFAGLAIDESRLTSIHYSLDSAVEWTAVLPDDGICDSNREKFSGVVKDVKPGSHRLTIRVVDSYNNSGYGSLTVDVPK